MAQLLNELEDEVAGKREIATSRAQDAARIALGVMLATAGTSHLTFAREDFKAQVPDWVPELTGIDTDTVVLQSGVVEIALGSALLFLPKQKRLVGLVAGAFFTAIFPGNISQYTQRRSAFGLDTDQKRFARLFFSRCWWRGRSGQLVFAGGRA